MSGISRVEISRNFPRERDLLEKYSRDFPRRYFVSETRREQRDLLKDTEKDSMAENSVLIAYHAEWKEELEQAHVKLPAIFSLFFAIS